MNSIYIALLVFIVLSPWVILAQCPDGVRVRKDFRDMTVDEWNQFLTGIKALRETPGSSGISRWEELTKMHSDYMAEAHADDNFGFWHRHFLRFYEDQIRSVNPNFKALPYWDWSADYALPHKSVVWDAKYLGGSASDGISPARVCVPNGPLSGFLYNSPDRHCLSRGFSQSTGRCSAYPDSSQQVRFFSPPELTQLIANERDFKRFHDILQYSVHSVPHTYIGGKQGEMYFIEKSVDDPIFFMHHAFVDVVLDRWQTQNKGARYPDTTYRAFPGKRSRDVWNLEATCVRYQTYSGFQQSSSSTPPGTPVTSSAGTAKVQQADAPPVVKKPDPPAPTSASLPPVPPAATPSQPVILGGAPPAVATQPPVIDFLPPKVETAAPAVQSVAAADPPVQDPPTNKKPKTKKHKSSSEVFVQLFTAELAQFTPPPAEVRHNGPSSRKPKGGDALNVSQSDPFVVPDVSSLMQPQTDNLSSPPDTSPLMGNGGGFQQLSVPNDGQDGGTLGSLSVEDPPISTDVAPLSNNDALGALNLPSDGTQTIGTAGQTMTSYTTQTAAGSPQVTATTWTTTDATLTASVPSSPQPTIDFPIVPIIAPNTTDVKILGTEFKIPTPDQSKFNKNTFYNMPGCPYLPPPGTYLPAPPLQFMQANMYPVDRVKELTSRVQSIIEQVKEQAMNGVYLPPTVNSNSVQTAVQNANSSASSLHPFKTGLIVVVFALLMI